MIHILRALVYWLVSNSCFYQCGWVCWDTKDRHWRELCNPVGCLPPEFSDNHFVTARTNLEGACFTVLVIAFITYRSSYIRRRMGNFFFFCLFSCLEGDYLPYCIFCQIFFYKNILLHDGESYSYDIHASFVICCCSFF